MNSGVSDMQIYNLLFLVYPHTAAIVTAVEKRDELYKAELEKDH